MLVSGGVPWVVPLPRIPVTTRIILFLVGDHNQIFIATGILGGGTTQGVPLTYVHYHGIYGQFNLGILGDEITYKYPRVIGLIIRDFP